MADNVHFLTVQDTVTPANSSGCNGFPFPFTVATPTDHQPLALSRANCVKLWWRVKNWNVASDVKYTAGTPPVDFPLPTGDMTPDPSNASTENDLRMVVPHSWSLPGVVFLDLLNSINQDSGQLYPVISLNGSPIGVTSIVSLDSTLGVFPYSLATSFTGTFDGNDVTVYLYINTTTGGTITGSFLDITPIEYWPYANSVGLPIWDTTTGIQLRGENS